MKKTESKKAIYYGLEYEIFEDGTIVGPERGIIKQRKNQDGYMEVTLGRLRDRHPRIKVHRIVAEQFVPNPNNYAEVNHIDYNRTNNHFSNLEWCTHQYNILHSQKAGHYKNKSGESNGRSKLTYDIVCNIRKDYADGMKICDISKKYNRPWSTINNVVKNHTWIMEDRA